MPTLSQLARRGRSKKVKKTSRRLRPEEEWIMIPVPAIIGKELFEKVGRQLKVN